VLIVELPSGAETLLPLEVLERAAAGAGALWPE